MLEDQLEDAGNDQKTDDENDQHDPAEHLEHDEVLSSNIVAVGSATPGDPVDPSTVAALMLVDNARTRVGFREI